MANFKIVNVVGCGQLDHGINLDRLAVLNDDHFHSEYSPESFPGVCLRLDRPRLSFLIFKPGKVVVSGARTSEEASLGFKIIQEKLAEYRLED